MAHEFDGKKYEKASSHQSEWAEKLISELDLRGNERVLDLGCGDGNNTAKIASLLPSGEVVGIDASGGMIEVAKKKKRANLKFMLMDINQLDFRNKFDVVFSNAALHWLTEREHKHLYKRLSVCLREGGIIRFNFAGDGNCSHFFKVVRKAIRLGKFTQYFAGFRWPWYMPTVDEYRLLVEQCGIRNSRVWGENADRFFPNTESMIRWLDQPSLVPLMAYVPKKDKPSFREFVVEEMIRETKNEDGRCFETFRRINLHARK